MYNNDNNISDPHGGYTPYWPGKDNVEYVQKRSPSCYHKAEICDSCSIVGLSF